MDDAQLQENLSYLTDEIAVLKADNERLFALLAAEDETPEQGMAPAAPTSWLCRATAQDWNDLMDWVDELMATYPVQQSYLFACWPAHPGIVEDLAGLKMAWEEAANKCAEGGWVGVEAWAYWHDRYLPGFFARLQPVHSAAMCKTRHESGTRPIRTQRDMAAVRSSGQLVTDAMTS